MHLLKEKTKPVPRQKRRRTIEALAPPARSAPVPIIAPQPRPSSIPESQPNHEESKESHRSKRNRTSVNPLM